MSDARRTAKVLLRLTPEDREELNSRASAEGRSVQEYAIARLLDRPDVRHRPGRRPRRPRQDEELPMTGT